MPQPPGPAAHSGASAPAGAKKWVGIAAEITPKRAINFGQSLSQPAADSSLYTREPFLAGDGGCGLPRRPVGPPRNDKGFLSFRGAERRGNPFFLRWTRGGTPGSSCPTGGCGWFHQTPWGAPARTRHPCAGCGGCRECPGEPAHSGAIAAAGAREGAKSVKRPSTKGTVATNASGALSEAESAGRVAGQIRFLPDDLRVQHGVHSSEVC